MTGYRFHPEAETDLDEIWDYIAGDNINAADRVSADIERALQDLVKSRMQDTGAPICQPPDPVFRGMLFRDGR